MMWCQESYSLWLLPIWLWLVWPIANSGVAGGWLRISKPFGTKWQDFQVIKPWDGPQVDLTTGCGIVGYRFEPETKSNQTSRPDFIMAYRTTSGYSPVKWFHCAQRWSHVGQDWSFNASKVFITADITPCTSLSF
jgi:hypothetical protein